MMDDPIRESIRSIADRLVETRHHLHANPELSDCEEKTAGLVADRLRSLGLNVRTGVGGHGVIAELEGALPGRTLAIRADIDALPIQEEADRPYRSQNNGVMHACGHDGHTTVLLGTVETLLKTRDSIQGRIRFLFQPAEETVGGAKRMCDAGAMEGVNAVIALHGWPQIGLGQIGVRVGAMMASADTFDIIVKGKSGHAAYPHATVDPIVIGSHLVQALQTIASREIDPNDPIVVSVTRFHAGTAYNIIPGQAHLAGTVRTLKLETRDSMSERLRRIAEGVCAAHRATCEFKFTEGSGPVVNDQAMTELIEQVASEVFGTENVIQLPHSSMGAEDFAAYLDHAPGAMFRLGLGDVSGLHTPTFDFPDAAIPLGVEMFTRIAINYLSDAR